MITTNCDPRRISRTSFLSMPLALVLLSASTGCASDDKAEEPSGGDESDYIVFEGTMVAAAQSGYFTDTYFTAIAGQPDVAMARSFLSSGSPFPGSVDAPAGESYLSLFHFSSEGGPATFLSSAEVESATSTLSTDFGAGEVSMMWRIGYRQSFVTEGAGADGPLNNVTFVALNPDPALETEIMDWEDETHIPWVMQYPGLAKVVRYEKIAGVEVNGAAFPKYIELFYFPDQVAADGLGPSQPFQDAEADRMATWTDEQLGIPFVLSGVLAAEK